jgi:thiamine biosynthesis lipoprotein
MGTRFELVLPGGEAERAVGEAALEEIEDCHARFSRFDEASLLNHILRTGAEKAVPLDADSFALFADAALVWRASGGAFDPTVPSRGMDAIVLDQHTRHIRLTRPLQRLDLGAIAKGHALELAAAVLRQHGVTRAFLHGGTSSALGIGAPLGATAWRVALARGGEARLCDRALSVSAVWDGNPHPTVDPRTGAAVPGPRRVMVIGPNARLADAWSTAALVLGRRPPTLSEEWGLTISDG